MVSHQESKVQFERHNIHFFLKAKTQYIKNTVVFLCLDRYRQIYIKVN